MRHPIWKQGIVWSTQPEAGLPPEEGNEATGTPEGGDRQDQGGGGGQPAGPNEADFPPGNANPALGID